MKSLKTIDSKFGKLEIFTNANKNIVYAKPSGYISPSLVKKDLAFLREFDHSLKHKWKYIVNISEVKAVHPANPISAFDINNKLIAVKTILEKCTSQEEMIERSLDPKIPGYIAQEIRNQRIENEIHIPNDKLEISNKSPYYLTYENITGEYIFSFITEENDLQNISIRIDPQNYKVSSLNPGILINKDEIQLINNGSILNLRFNLSGLASFLQLDIYVKTYYLNENSKKVQGIFSGVDFENRLVSGNLEIQFTA